MSVVPKTAPTPANNVVLRHLTGMRKEIETVLERQARTVELVQRCLGQIGELRSDQVLLENAMLSRQDEILAILRRLERIEDERAAPAEHSRDGDDV